MPVDFGAPIAQNVNVNPNQGIQTLSGLMGLQQQQQAIQSRGLGIQQQQAELPAIQAQSQITQMKAAEQQRVSQMFQSGVDDQGNSIKDASGEIDPAKAVPALGRIAPLTGQQVAQSVIQTHADKIGLQSASQTLDTAGRQRLAGPLQALALNPSDENIATAKSTIDQLVQAHPEMGPAADHINGLLQHVGAVQDPKQRATLANSLSAMVQPSTAVATQPTAGVISTGAVQQPVVTAPPVAGGAVTKAPGAIAAQIPPQIYTNAAQQPQIVGGVGAGPGNITGSGGQVNAGRLKILNDELAKATDPSDRAALQREIATVSGGQFPASYDVAARTAAAGDMTNHFAALNASAGSLPLVSGLTKTIEGLAPSAFVGPGQDKRQYWAGLARVFGINLTGDAQTDTNLLSKAMAQLNISTPAGTDAARTLVEAGQPNTHMDADAIKEAAGTIRGQVLMNTAERNFLGSTRYQNGGAGNPQGYQQQRQQFEGAADPRIWQYEDLLKTNKKAAASFIQRQPDKAGLVQQTTALQQMGLFK